MPFLPTRSLAPAHLAALALSFGLAGSMIAQSGDRPNDPQQPPPEHWEIPPAPALSAEEALETFALAPGFKIEVVAADPLVFDPIAMQIGPDGRIWVVEMRGYMPNVDGIGEDAPIGTIAVLADTDGDGRMDHRTEFADGVVMPRGVALVADGVLVAAPPMLWHMRDTDGDNIADERTVVSETYGDRQNPEHTANGLMWGLDNWIYNANDDERFRWNQGKWDYAPAPDRGQWGIAQDDAGRLFYNTNSSPLKFDLFPGEYLLRNPDLKSHHAINRETIANDDLPLFPSRITPGVNRGYKILDEDGYLPHMTAASAPVIYRSSLFPEAFYGDAFIPEPSGNLIKRLKLSPTVNGDWVGTNPYDHFEFLTSTDERFRPVSLYNGPDGALYIVDMYRGIIQHRIFVTSFLRAQIIERGLETPIGMGRIYRVVPDGTAPLQAPDLATATTAELVAALNRPDAWWRETAQRLLVEQRDSAAAPALQAIALDPTNPGHLNALWTLHGIGAFDESVFIALSKLSDPDVRVALLRISEDWLAEDLGFASAHLQKELMADDPIVRRQAVLSAGSWSHDSKIAHLNGAVELGGDIAGMAEALISSLHGLEVEFLKTVSKPMLPELMDGVTLATDTVIHRGDATEVAALFDLLLAPSTDPSFATALLAGIEGHTQNRKGDRMRLSLPVEPTALIKFAGKGNAALSARAHALLEYIDGPAARAAMAQVEPLTASEQILFDQGKTIYALCAGCHQADGRGMNGLAPSLVGSKWAVGPAEIAAAIVLKGKEGAQLAMPPLESLDDTSIAAALTFIRRSWGHTASAVTPEVVATAREHHQSRLSAWDEASLSELTATLTP